MVHPDPNLKKISIFIFTLEGEGVVRKLYVTLQRYGKLKFLLLEES